MLRLFFVTFLFLGSWCGAATTAVPFERRPFGLEIEYGVDPAAASGLTSKEIAAKLLEPVTSMSKTKSQVRISHRRKYLTGGTLYVAEVLDPYGRIWRSEPERTRSESYDGRELVSPPLTRHADMDMVVRVRRELESGSLFVPARESSIHFNYDVSDLIDAKGDARKLVNVILFFEQHWPEIYRLVKPRRMGTIVNHFSVPMAANQMGLFYRLAQLPVENRSFKRVRKMFLNFQLQELNLVHGIPGRIWKFRAANYGKILRLFSADDPSAYAPIIELRLSDLVDEKKMRELDARFTAIIEYAANLPPITEFHPPFVQLGPHAVDQKTDFSELNRQIQEIPYERVQAFKDRVITNCGAHLSR